MMRTISKFLPIAVVLALVAAGVLWMVGSNGDTKLVTAYFPRTVSVYEGSDVRVLGVAVGTVDSVVPEGTKVRVEMRYDSEVEVPMDAKAVIISPSVVGDRYIQLTPAYESGEVLPDNTVLDTQRTSVPLELDEIYQSIDDLVVALGPQGANQDGALTDLLQTTAENFGGQGAQFRETIEDFGQLSKTLDDNKDELFGSVRQLNNFVRTLAENDGTVRDFNTELGNISTVLADERQELTTALAELGTALQVVGDFVDENKQLLGRNIKKVGRVTDTLVKRRAQLDELLEVAPLAYNNLAHTYNPQTGTLDTNANVAQLLGNLQDDPALVLCTLLGNADNNGNLCDLFKTILPRSGPFGAGTGSRADATYDPTLSGVVPQ
ncbi:MCE family protein [Nocardioides panacisoli]|uniref:MCE family protein n=1 Tax=Nocardioides panacisoli TaxID=627624 RepID=UPI001C639932|nr:MCE family protein [Nocardioides panacisoli]QYJ03849.1 MCE family protein [Nocardioides panacisoli]